MCVKRKFSKRAASIAVTRALLAQIRPLTRADYNRHEQRAYHCKKCDHWHLTSQPENISLSLGFVLDYHARKERVSYDKIDDHA